jgi:Family of unknown function (DUF6459)
MSLRLVKVPDAVPPYDCDTHGAWCPAVRGTTATRHDPGRRPVPVLDAGRRPVPAGAGRAAADLAGALPWQFARVIVEIMAGQRPPKQLAGVTTERACGQARRLAPLLASDRRPVIRRIVTSRPTARVMEMTVVLSIGPRSRALAMRLERLEARPAAPGRPGRPDRWLCTAIEAG